MSDSDSDLDFESADEDAICDVNVENNNASPEKLRSEVIEDTVISTTSPKDKLSSAEIPEEETNTNESKETPLNLNNLQITDTQETDKNVNGTYAPTDNICGETENLVNDSKIKRDVSTLNEEDNVYDSIKNETSANKNQEKQRVTLRLEKKIQQKQQLLKDNSVENGTKTSTEISSVKEEPKSSWGFGSWGTNLLSTAASSVSTFTSQVSQGIGTVLETVETTLGAPPPEELAAVLNEKKASKDSSEEKAMEDENSIAEKEEENNVEVKSSLLPNVSSWTKVLENTGSKVLMGGLDTLELIGKKTIDMITEGDPGLRKKRAVFSDGTTLSQMLREAKDNAEESKEDNGKETVNYSQMFDEYQGLIHLEALEILSQQSDIKIQKLSIRHEISSEVKKQMEMIKSSCEGIPDADEPDLENLDHEYFFEKCTYYAYQMSLPFNVEKIIKAHEKISKVIQDYEDVTFECTVNTPQEMYHSAVCSLAELTAKSIEAFHKLAELILIQTEPPQQMFINNLIGLTLFLCTGINNLASRYHHCLDSVSEKCDGFEKANSTVIVTNLYLEAENSKKYIQDAFLLLSPVLQVSVLETSN